MQIILRVILGKDLKITITTVDDQHCEGVLWLLQNYGIPSRQ